MSANRRPTDTGTQNSEGDTDFRQRSPAIRKFLYRIGVMDESIVDENPSHFFIGAG